MNNKAKKGKTLEEIYGIEKAIKIKDKIKNSRKGYISYKKGKNYNYIYGEKKALKIKEKIGKAKKGKSLEELYGKEQADKIKEKTRKTLEGKSYVDRFGEKKAEIIKINKRKIKNITQIEDVIIKIFKYNKRVTKRDFFENKFVRDIGHRAIQNELRRKHVSLDNIANKIGLYFSRRHCSFGQNETQILDNIEKEKNIQLERQYYVAGRFIDGYDKHNNIAYEVDEAHHKSQKIQDIIRENNIRERLGCEFVRIKDGWTN